MKEEIIMSTEIDSLIANALETSITYIAYRALVQNLSKINSTSGPNHSEDLIFYTDLNNARMRRLDKTIKISEETERLFVNYTKKVTWLVLTESWCGDAAQALPVINKLAEIAPHVTLKLVLRDENTELMRQFLTNGGMSIPKLIVIDNASQIVLGDWGPRPTVATKMVEAFKAEHGSLTPQFKEDLQVWYTKDKGQAIVDDLEKLLL